MDIAGPRADSYERVKSNGTGAKTDWFKCD
jgi:hypothetical protein